jgi:uncharacterized protein with von Willebrand factor type A (vWA) domain
LRTVRERGARSNPQRVTSMNEIPQTSNVNNEWDVAETLLLNTTDPLRVNELAIRLGTKYVLLKSEAADKEAHRTVLRARIEQRLKDSGEATSDKAAERLAKENHGYTAYCEDLSALELKRDIAEVLYKAAHQRAWLLGNNPVRVDG